MGLSAFVCCRCWSSGRISPPSFADFLEIDTSDGTVGLSRRAPDFLWEACELWRKSACPHENMKVAFEQIANWSGYRWFQERVRHIGVLHLPVLHRVLPESNDGSVSTSDAAVALRELDEFGARSPQQTIALINTHSGAVLRDCLEEPRILFMSGGDVLALSPVGFVVCDDIEAIHAPRFVSRRFSQLKVADRHYLLRDRETGVVCRSCIGLRASDEDDASDAGELFFEVVDHATARGEFDYILPQLRRVFSASVQVGNPVVWC